MDREAEDGCWPPPGTVPRGPAPGAGNAPPARRRRGGARAAVAGGAAAATPAPSAAAAAARAAEGAGLWAAVLRGVAPLPGRPAPPPSPPPPSVTVEPPRGVAPRPAAPPARPVPPAELAVGLAPAGLDAKRWNGLRRGKLRPERKLDLHGLRAEQAHAAVHRFVAGAQADGLRCVCVVTGKGSTPEGGRLRRELPHWLNSPALRPLVLAAAHPHSANTGAVHILLRRRGR